MNRRTRARQITLATASAAALSVMFSSSASASWTKAGTAAGTGKASSVGAVTVTVPSSTTNGTVAVGWTAATAPAGASRTYVVERKSGASYTTVCGTGTTPTVSLSCNDTSVANGTYQYRVTAKVGSIWATASSDSSSVTVTTVIATLSIDSFTPGNGHSVTASGTAAVGTTGDGSVTMVFCKVNTWPCSTSPNQVAATITVTQANIDQATGAWSATTGNIGNGTVVYGRATQARTAGALTSNVAGPVTA